MKEVPILFSTPMVQAILEGRKTTTRRIIKPQPTTYECDGKQMFHYSDKKTFIQQKLSEISEPFLGMGDLKYKIGDVLWVRETFGFGTRPCTINGWRDGIEYRADEKYIDDIEGLPLYDLPNGMEFKDKKGWKPSLFMPKEAARIWLEITDIKVERLQDISDKDSLREGIPNVVDKITGFCGYDYMNGGYNLMTTPYKSFRSLWRKINGEESWNENPFVWCISFKVLSTTGKPKFKKLIHATT